MYRSIKVMFVVLILALASGCSLESRSADHRLRITFSPANHDHWGWAAATAMVFDYHHNYYSQTDVVDYHHYYFGHGGVSIDEISWLLWNLEYIDSIVTGTLSFREIRSNIDSGNPVLLHYGDYYGGHFLVLHGYDDNGYVYIHEPNYGTRVIHYDDLYYRFFHSQGHYWISSLIVLG